MSTGTFVLIVAVVAALIAGCLLSWLLYRALHDGADRAVWWRGVKVISASVSVIGLVLALLAFEKIVRELNDGSEKYLNEQFLELKFYTTYLKAVACSKDMSDLNARNECFDFRNIDNQVSYAALKAGSELKTPTNWQRNVNLNEVIEEVARKFERMNAAMASAHENPILSSEQRMRLTFVALLLIILSIAGSIGESVFQYQQEKNRRR